MASITRERAERIARSHACSHCQEYNFKKLAVRPAPKSIEDELGVLWLAVRTCGICKAHTELGIQADGDIVFES